MRLLTTLWIIGLSFISYGQFMVPIQIRGGACCCGQFEEVFFPNLDFESGPSPSPGTFITYGVGQNFGGWTVTTATIDHCDALVGNLGAGNPNGPSFFVDLHGSPGQGGISYDLFGLTPGNQYRIEFWTAQNGGGFSSDGHLKIAGGAWLNVSWTVSTSGAIAWSKETFEFMAMASSATMEFSSTGPQNFQGTLIDDIHIFECPGDTELPEVLNPPDDLDFNCDKDVPRAPRILVSDNCDPNPFITLKETTEIIDPCTKRITRNWEISDDCGNTAKEDQIITVSDLEPPEFTKTPEDKSFDCTKDILKEFNDWIKKNGNATATDICGTVTWRASFDREPTNSCDTILVEFIVTDHCGNENSESANFIVRDTTIPKFIIEAQSKNLVCVPNARDSLRNWLLNFGYSKTTTDCDTVIMSSNFNGDSSQNPLKLLFFSRDRCGNSDTSSATFSYRSGSDTFRINTFSCTYLQNSFDTSSFVVNGCDSIVIESKIKLKNDSTYLQLHLCDSLPKIYDTIYQTNLAGCDSLIFYEYVFHPINKIYKQTYDCSFNSYSTDTLSLNGQFCDSLIISEYIPLQKDTSFFTNYTCDSLLVDTIVQTLTNVYGCDSIATTFTLFNQQKITNVTLSECGLLNNYIDTVKHTSNLCDSLVITQHLALRIDSSFVQDSSCKISQTGIFVSKLINQFGCDSIVVKNVKFLTSDSIAIIKSTCNFADAGLKFERFTNRNGCDSIIAIQTDFIPSDTTRFDSIVCMQSLAGKDTLFFSQNICDSIVFINYNYVAPDTAYVQLFTCDTKLVSSDTSLHAGKYCDSLVITRTDLLASDTILLNASSCNPIDTGLKSKLLINRNGCDSLVLTQTNYTPLHLEYNIDSISCFNENDGRINILNQQDFNNPFDIYLNNTRIQNQTGLTQLKPGTYELYIRDRRNCLTDTIYFQLNNPPELQIDLGSNLEVKKSSKVDLELQHNNSLSAIIWTPSNITSCNNCDEINFIANDNLWIYVQAIDERGCSQTDSVYILVKKQFTAYAPNSFSPNGDQINDYFFIQGDENGIVETLIIFDRWGELVFEANNIHVNDPTTGWVGNYRSNKLNPAVFVFFARIKSEDGEMLEIKGDLTLIR